MIDWMTRHLVGVAEIARMLGVSRQRVHQIIASEPDFPKPEARLSAGAIWSTKEVESWIRSKGRGPERSD
jgi:predicted DNA-binding transcriptional regulator AlpA